MWNRHERGKRIQEEQEAELASIMDAFLTDKVILLDEIDRDKLRGKQTRINHLRKTRSGFGVIKEVDFTLIDGTTFMWNKRLPAAIAYGRTPHDNQILLTGGVFHPGSLRKTGIETSNPENFPALIGEIPGYANLFDNALSFRIAPQPETPLHLTFGGREPDTRVSTDIFGRNNYFQIFGHLRTAVKRTLSHT